MLRRHEARGTFFVLGQAVEANPDTLLHIKAEGHEIGNHTYDHPDAGAERDDRKLREQIERTNRCIERIALTPPRLMRPPYGRDVCRVARLASECGLSPTVLWSIQSWDWEAPPAEQIAGRVLAETRPGAIILLHDGAPPHDERTREPTVEALGSILPALREDGYECLTVSELLADVG